MSIIFTGKRLLAHWVTYGLLFNLLLGYYKASRCWTSTVFLSLQNAKLTCKSDAPNLITKVRHGGIPAPVTVSRFFTASTQSEKAAIQRS
ncbi:hypothetical protein L1987_61789 [Smallanthus sonchifolius]|uniref:Uncharacterized protein n=1 Tax=Smallanthus sonchifolius TaxID=185202 RepID=A0ACB9C8X2_9ASTR|nr:hypothetical protein L1987_61789 [Smallanthus sonchifolius]